MPRLIHFRLCPASRAMRIALAELRIEADLVEERPWEWRPAFLTLNPAGELPVYVTDAGTAISGLYAISEYLGDEPKRHLREVDGVALFPGSREDRAEIRRLVDWFHMKLGREVTKELLSEKIYARLRAGTPLAPDPDVLRAIRANLRYHLSYLNHLAHERRWLAGDDLSFADIVAAAQLSVADYLGEVPWGEYTVAKSWYARFKSRPAFRSLLSDRMPGAPPPESYADLDF